MAAKGRHRKMLSADELGSYAEEYELPEDEEADYDVKICVCMSAG